MNFTSQICTNIEQSEKLLALGLRPETADMSISTRSVDTDNGMHYSLIPYSECKYRIMYNVIPAWSLNRLIEMCNKAQFGMTIGIYRDEVTVDGELFEVYDNTYDNLISIIEWLIGLGKFNKNYLDIH